jgi:hypothetical protein
MNTEIGKHLVTTERGCARSVKAPEGWRSPRRFAYFRNHHVAHSVLDCGGPPPLFPGAYQTVPGSTGTVAFHWHLSLLQLVLWTQPRSQTEI